MAVPFLLAGAAVLVGGYKIKKDLDAEENMNKARNLNECAKDLVSSTERKIKNYRNSTNEAMKQLGITKIFILSNNMSSFINYYCRIENIDFKDSIALKEIHEFNPNSQEFLDTNNTCDISPFSGYGLGSANIIADPIPDPILDLIKSIEAEKESKKNLEDAHFNLDQARKFEQDGENICSVLEAIKNRADQIDYLLKDLDDKFSSFIGKMTTIIEMRGNDWNNYRDKDKKEIGITVQLANTIKAIIDTSLLKENGELDDYQSQKVLNAGQRLLSELN